MRISDWSSDVCSSDRQPRAEAGEEPRQHALQAEADLGEVAHRFVAGAKARIRRRQRQRAIRTGHELVAGRIAHRPQVEDRQVLGDLRSEEHTSELQSLMRISYAVL